MHFFLSLQCWQAKTIVPHLLIISHRPTPHPELDIACKPRTNVNWIFGPTTHVTILNRITNWQSSFYHQPTSQFLKEKNFLWLMIDKTLSHQSYYLSVHLFPLSKTLDVYRGVKNNNDTKPVSSAAFQNYQNSHQICDNPQHTRLFSPSRVQSYHDKHGDNHWSNISLFI